jgi:hypothetical protein
MVDDAYVDESGFDLHFTLTSIWKDSSRSKMPTNLSNSKGSRFIFGGCSRL